MTMRDGNYITDPKQIRAQQRSQALAANQEAEALTAKADTCAERLIELASAGLEDSKEYEQNESLEKRFRQQAAQARRTAEAIDS